MPRDHPCLQLRKFVSSNFIFPPGSGKISRVPPLTLARNAMNTRFEIALHGGGPDRLRALAEEALDEITRLDAQLSAYNRLSELSQINARAAGEPVRVEPQLFRLLQHAKRLWSETGGAFDITIAPLMRAWGFVRDTGRRPTAAELEAARACTGMQHVHLDEGGFTVRFARPGMVLDLGAIGKGYALDRAGRILREAEVAGALLHGGTSSVLAIGADAEGNPWRVAIEHPRPALSGMTPAGGLSIHRATHTTTPEILAVVPLRDESISVSAVWGKAFEADGRVYGHVMDPRRDEPTDSACLAAVVLPSATETDALSTALLTLGPAGLEKLAALREGMRALVVSPAASGFQVAVRGIAASSV